MIQIRKIREITLLSLVIVSFGAYSQTISSCQIYLEPITGFDLVIGDSLKNISMNFNKLERVTGNEATYVPEGISYYTTSKPVILPNGYKTVMEINVLFKEDLLAAYNLNFSIGDDFKYYYELIDYIKEHDKKKINAFIYDAAKSPSYYDVFNNKDCRRLFSLKRGDTVNNVSTFNIFCKVN